MQQEVVTVDQGAFDLRMGRKPEAIIAEARLCARALVAEVRENKWAQKYGGREHLFFEAWSFLAKMYDVAPSVCECRLLEIDGVRGYEAVAEAIHVPSGRVVSRAESMCLNDEENWDRRPKYEWRDGKRIQTGDTAVPLFQLRSMAQTRAMAKALKAPFSWVIAMAGYAPTPADEMPQARPGSDERPIQPPMQKPATANPGAVITPAQLKRLFAIVQAEGVERRIVLQIISNAGFDKPEDITMARYDEIIQAIQQAKGGPNNAPA